MSNSTRYSLQTNTAPFFSGAVQRGPDRSRRQATNGGWQHTLACGIGSTGDLILFSLILLGGDYLFPDLANPTLQTVLAAIGAIVLLPLEIYLLVRVVKEPLRAYVSVRQHWDEGTVPGHVLGEVGNAAALTIFNPLTTTYWVGVTSNWLAIAHSVLSYRPPLRTRT